MVSMNRIVHDSLLKVAGNEVRKVTGNVKTQIHKGWDDTHLGYISLDMIFKSMRPNVPVE